MKKYLATMAVLVIAMLLALGACTKVSKEETPQAQEPIEAPQEVPQEPEQPVVTKTVTTTTPKTTTPTKTVETQPASDYTDKKVKGLMQKAEQKTTSYAFYYQTSANWDLIRDQYFIKGDKMKVKLFEVNFYNRQHYFDTVYLNMADKTGLAYCENRDQVRCTDQNREFTVAYEDFVIKTPLEWIEEVPKDAKWTGTEQIDSRAADVIEYERGDGTTVRLKVDAYSGVPREVYIYRGDVENVLEKYAFRDLAINSVKNSDIEHQFI